LHPEVYDRSHGGWWWWWVEPAGPIPASVCNRFLTRRKTATTIATVAAISADV